MSGEGFAGWRKAAAASAVLAVAALLIAACGGSARTRTQPMLVHLDGQVTGDYVRETSATGIGFLVPTGVLAGQGATSFDIATPPPANSNTIQLGPKLTRPARTWFYGPSITGSTPERAHVELLVTGDPGRRIYLGFEESCGFFHVSGGPKAVSAKRGASGQRVMRTPAVMIVPGLTSNPENDCYVSGMVATHGQNHLHISLIDY